jgi:hypothetical protein
MRMRPVVNQQRDTRCRNAAAGFAGNEQEMASFDFRLNPSNLFYLIIGEM